MLLSQFLLPFVTDCHSLVIALGVLLGDYITRLFSQVWEGAFSVIWVFVLQNQEKMKQNLHFK